MAINTKCSECGAAYTLADQQRGKKVRCKHCSAVFVVGAAVAKKAAAAVEEEITERPQARSRPAAAPARRAAPAKARKKDDDDDDEVQIKKPKHDAGGRNNMPWIIGGGLAAITIVVAGVITLIVLLREPNKTASNTETTPSSVPSTPPPVPAAGGGQQPPVPVQPRQGSGPAINPRKLDQQPVQPVKVVQPDVPPVKPDDKPVKTTRTAESTSASRGNRELTPEANIRVERATVYLRVTMPDGTVAAGSGFFGSTEARNIILTNAHVVGMLSPESLLPKRVQVFVNSGKNDEWDTEARVLGIDRLSDLAVLQLTPKPGKTLPDPLAVRSAEGLRRTERLYIAGFPLGENLGKEVSINPTTVSTLRHKKGVFERIEVNGGMTHGNSGGPVVDPDGVVVGVAVAGIEGTQINFAIPADRVLAILHGRPAAVSIHQPYYAGDKRITAPVRVQMIDPRLRIKSVALEVWVGDKPASEAQSRRPQASSQPGKLPGDLDRQRFTLRFDGTEYLGEIALPELPERKIWWQQLMWINQQGKSQWATASELKLPSDPVTHEPAKLVLGNWRSGTRKLKLTMDNTLRLGSHEELGAFNMHTEAEFREKVVSSNSSGTTVNLWYDKEKTYRDISLPRRGKQPDSLLRAIRDYLPTLVMQMQYDAMGNIVGHPTLPVVNDRRLAEAMAKFHMPVKQGLEVMAISLPGKSVKPGESWESTRTLPIDTPGKFESGQLRLTFTYLGTRKGHNNRKEAVLEINGDVQGAREVGDAVGGRASGKAIVNVMTGEVIQAEITVVLDLKALVPLRDDKGEEMEREMRVLDTVSVRLKRG